jgi:hypothetical protein
MVGVGMVGVGMGGGVSSASDGSKGSSPMRSNHAWPLLPSLVYIIGECASSACVLWGGGGDSMGLWAWSTHIPGARLRWNSIRTGLSNADRPELHWIGDHLSLHLGAV